MELAPCVDQRSTEDADGQLESTTCMRRTKKASKDATVSVCEDYSIFGNFCKRDTYSLKLVYCAEPLTSVSVIIV